MIWLFLFLVALAVALVIATVEVLIEKLDLNEIEIKEKIKEEIERFKKFQQILLGKKEKATVDNIDIYNYAKYILREGKNVEKRELLGCLRGKITLKEKKITVSEL